MNQMPTPYTNNNVIQFPWQTSGGGVWSGTTTGTIAIGGGAIAQAAQPETPMQWLKRQVAEVCADGRGSGSSVSAAF